MKELFTVFWDSLLFKSKNKFELFLGAFSWVCLFVLVFALYKIAELNLAK
jgi:hypothetical protein